MCSIVVGTYTLKLMVPLRLQVARDQGPHQSFGVEGSGEMKALRPRRRQVYQLDNLYSPGIDSPEYDP